MSLFYLQMYHPAAYMPMMYQGYHPYYGPVFYRPHPGMFQGGPLKGIHRGSFSGHKIRMSAVPHHAGEHIPIQKDSDDRSASESPQSDSGHPARAPVTEPAPVPVPGPAVGHAHGAAAGIVPGASSTGSPLGKKPHQKARMVYMPKAVPYQPYFAYPHYVLPPEDPRYTNMPVGIQPPYFYNYGGFSARHPYMGPQVPFHMQPRPTGSGSLSPASSTEGSIIRPQSQTDLSPTGSNQSDSRSYSPALSPGSSVTGIQVLPNVKHVPSHLFTTPGSGSNSRSSTPVQSSSPLTVTQPATQQQKEEPASHSAASQTAENTSNTQTEKEFPTFRKRQLSGPRPVSQSPSYSSQSSHESSMSPTLDFDQTTMSEAKTETQFKLEMSTQQSHDKISSLQMRVPKNLKLNTTGFSRQFSDDLGTPTEVTKLVKMIEENIEEIDEGAVGDKTEVLFQDESQLMKPSPPSGKLYLNLKAPPQSEESVSQSSSGSSVDDDVRRSYAGVVLKKIPSYKDQELPLLEPQTPMTPAGFITPGTDMNTDPLEILKNLNINNDNLNRSTHGHFY